MSSLHTDTAARLRDELSAGELRLKPAIDDLRAGSLQQHRGLWLNTAGACPVPKTVVQALQAALSAPHVTLQRGHDRETRAAALALREVTRRFERRLGLPAGQIVLGHNTTHLLLAVGRALLTLRPGSPWTVAHGDPDHRASYVFSALPGWKARALVPYSHNGLYEQRAITALPPQSVFLMTAQHPLYGAVQGDALRALRADTHMIVDGAQALKWLSPAQLAPFLQRSEAAVFSLGKAFSPLSAGFAWVRDAALTECLLAQNPELSGSVSGFSVAALSATQDFLDRTVDAHWSAHTFALTRYLLLLLSGLDHITVLGCPSFQDNSDRIGLVSLRADNMTPEELAMHLEASGFSTRADGTCAGPIEEQQAHAAVRISLLPHVRFHDIDHLVLSLAACA